MPSTELRQTVLSEARRLVVKIGSQLLTDDAGKLDTTTATALGHEVAQLIERGYDITLVSSGSIAVGRAALALEQRPSDIGVLQAVAAVGQTGLMDLWRDVFAEHDLRVAQMLLNRDDFEDRKRYLNIRNCLGELHAMRVVPIVNENDTVSVDEIRLGDNDVLSALVTNALPADALILLSVVDGVRNPEGQVVEIVENVYDATQWITGKTSDHGTGGMETKLEAVRLVTDAGEIAVIAGGREPQVLSRLLGGEKLGTVFVPAGRKMASRLRWISQTVRPAGVLVVDEGAVRAVVDKHKSLLAVGITEVVGQYDKGDVVVVRDSRGREVARGLINYTAEETRAIMGRRSEEFSQLLCHNAYDEVVHRDNLVVTLKN